MGCRLFGGEHADQKKNWRKKKKTNKATNSREQRVLFYCEENFYSEKKEVFTMNLEVMIRYALVGLGSIVLVVMTLFVVFGRHQHKIEKEEKNKQSN